MPGLAPSVAAVRLAVRRCLAARLDEVVATSSARPPLVLVACSGGPDSLALATAARFVVGRTDLSEADRVGCGLVTIDHGLQEGSADRAAKVAAWARDEGFAPVLAVPVGVAGRSGGPEAAAREARYEALAEAARSVGAAAVLLGHTRDDQAETVLLALARGAGARGLAGMPEQRICHGVTFLRPLLDVARADTRAACDALDLRPWDDPHNVAPVYARARVRAAMPCLVEALGPDLVANLARTATLLAADVQVLDGMAEQALAAAATGPELSVTYLTALPAGLRTRVLHRWARDLGVPGSALSYRHVVAMNALVVAWHGQGPVSLPGGSTVARRGDRLIAKARDG